MYGILPVYVFAYHIDAVPGNSEEDTSSPGTGVSDSD